MLLLPRKSIRSSPQHLFSSTIIFYASLERKWAWTSPPTNTILLQVHAKLSGRHSLEVCHVPMSLVSNYWHHSSSNSEMLLSLSYVYQGSIAILPEIVNSFPCPPYKYNTINGKNTYNIIKSRSLSVADSSGVWCVTDGVELLIHSALYM